MDQRLIAALRQVLAEIDDKALKALKGWVNEWGYGGEGKDILKYKDQYPKPTNNTLYRVVFVDGNEYKNILKKGLTPRNKYLESWSLTDRAVTAYSEDYAESLDDDWGDQYIVFFRKKIPEKDMVVDLTQVAHLLPEETASTIDIEKEVLVQPQKLTKANVYKVIKYDTATGKKTTIR